MFSYARDFLTLSIFLVLLLSLGVVGCTADNKIIASGFENFQNSSLTIIPYPEEIIIPPPTVNNTKNFLTALIPNDTNQVVSAQSFVDPDLETMASAVLVPIYPTPEGSGYYYFNPTGTDPNYYIYESGIYTLQDGFSTNNSSAIWIGASDVILDGNTQTIIGNFENTGILSSGIQNVTVRNFAGIREFYFGIDSFSNQVILTNNSISDNDFNGINATGNDITVTQNSLYNNSNFGGYINGIGANILKNSIHNNMFGMGCYGDNSIVDGNKIFQNEYFDAAVIGIGALIQGNELSQSGENLHTTGNDTIITQNTVSSTTGWYGYGIFSLGNNLTLSENILNNNGLGIIALGDSCSVRNNRAYLNQNGIGIIGNNGTISDNIIRDTTGIGTQLLGYNSAMTNNIISNVSIGAVIFDLTNSTITGNQINTSSTTGIFINENEEGTEGGAIYDNYFGSELNIDGSGRFSKFHYIWTNPEGPQPGINVRGGPFIAGNYWSNQNGTGWSDTQTPNVTGYTTTPYEVVLNSGIFDTAPLIPQKTVSVNATANDWAIIVPNGNSSYQSYTNQTFIAQAKPGADITDLIVDSVSKQNVTSWTFTELIDDHTIQAIGNATPGQVHVFFNASDRYGEKPLTVSFSSEQTLGTPTSWYWQFGDGTSNSTQNPVHTYDIPGTYTVTLRALNSQTGGYAVWNNYITVTDGPVPEPTQTQVPGNIIPKFSAYPAAGNAPLIVDYRDLSSGNPVTWVWDFGDGEQSSLQNPSHTYTTKGSYPVTLSATNANYGASLTIPDAIVVT